MKPLNFEPQEFLATAGVGKKVAEYRKGELLFSQGEPAKSVIYIQKGKVKLTVISRQGKEAVIAIFGARDFVGEGCLAGQSVRMATAKALTPCTALRIDSRELARVIHRHPAFSDFFVRYVLMRNIRVEEDLVDHLFNSSEKRLARVLLLLANYGRKGKPASVMPKISQETLAEMVGTTRPRISFFMNKFRKLGFIEYNDGLEIHTSLLSVVLHD